MASELLTDLASLTTVNPNTLFYIVDGGTSYQTNLNTIGAGITGGSSTKNLVTGVSVTGSLGITGQFSLSAGSNITFTAITPSNFSVASSAAAGISSTIFTGLSNTGWAWSGQRGTFSIDFNSGAYQYISITGNTLINTTNRLAGKTLTCLIKATGQDSNVTNFTPALAFNTSWHWLGAPYVTGLLLTTGKFSALSLTAWGPNESDVFSSYVPEI